MRAPARWVLPEPNPEAAVLAASLGVGMPAARVLCARGYRDVQAAARFLDPGLEDLLDPFLLAGMRAASTRLLRAIRGGQKVLLYGDYDVDGTTSIVILKKAIEMAGGAAAYHVPHRLTDGYGMRPEVIDQAAADGVRLLISVDTGIRAAAVVERANQHGLDVIITDHHLPEAELPPALAVLNPNRPDCPYPNKNLCGAGVAFKLVQALLGELDWPAAKVRRITESFLKMTGIATVADVVPLVGENRVIVKHGLSGLGQVRNPGLRALLDVAGFTGDSIPSATQVAFRIAPRMNATGRMDSALPTIELFLTDDPERARELARELHERNAERQQVEAEVVRAILDECARVPVGDADGALVFAGENWHRGVLGIAAGRLVERFHRPVFVLSHGEDGLAQGSGRSIPAFHLLEALEAMPELFVKFGGHRQAAGVTLEAARVDDFRRRLNQWAAARLTAEDRVPQLAIDAVVDVRELDDAAVAGVLRLAPFGLGNPAPIFAALDAEVAGPPSVWKEKHLRLTVRHNGRSLFLKAWNFADLAPSLAPGMRVDVAFTVEEDPYSAARGYAPWAAVLRALRLKMAARS